MSDTREVARNAAALLKQFGELAGRWSPLPHQVPPPPGFYGWMLMAGRGAGKTDTCANYMVRHVQGPPCLKGPHPHWMGIIAPTLGDAATSCFSGPSGISAHDPTATMVTTKGGTIVRWPNGSEAKLFGAHTEEDVDRLRSGGNRCLQWLEEMAAWRWLDDAWHHMRFGLRSGPNPHWVASTTPRPRPLIKKIDKGDFDRVVVTHASMYDNPHLPEDIRNALEEAYAGTSLGAQELLGRIVEQDENALWRREHIERNRVRVDDIERIIVRRTVGVDPSGGAGEQGIVVTAKTEKVEMTGFQEPVAKGFVLADASCHLPAAAWGLRVVDTAIEWDADDICVEKNFGGDMAIEVVSSAIEKRGVSIPVRFTIASRGKQVRAAPVGALTEQDRFGFAGTFEALEDQLCTWTPEIGYSPDRLDAMVWGPHHFKLVHLAVRGKGTIGTQAARQPIGGASGGRPVPPQAAAEQRRTLRAMAPGSRVIG